MKTETEILKECERLDARASAAFRCGNWQLGNELNRGARALAWALEDNKVKTVVKDNRQ
jgi:hypothetical protein